MNCLLAHHLLRFVGLPVDCLESELDQFVDTLIAGSEALANSQA